MAAIWRSTSNVELSKSGCQGFFLDHLATYEHSVRLASEVLHFGWEWDPLTLLPAEEIASMGRMLRNLTDLHLHHQDLLELQYLTRQNISSSDIRRLDLGLQGLISSVSSYFASFGTGMGFMIILIIVGLSYLNCRRGESAQPSSGPIVVQAPAANPAPVIIGANSISAPLLQPPLDPTPALAPFAPPLPKAKARKRRHQGRSCCGLDGSDDDFTIRYRSDREELAMLRDCYNYDTRPGTDPRFPPIRDRHPAGRSFNDSGTESPSHHELHDRLKNILQ
jgi:hypothetical protein